MIHYYLNMYGNIEKANAVKKAAQDQFGQFERYLRNSIAALEEKSVEASWENVEQKNLAELSVIGGIYEFSRQTTVRINNNRKGYYRIELTKGNPNYSKKIEFQFGDTEGEAVVTEDDYKRGLVFLEGIETKNFDNLRWGFADITLTPDWFTLKKGDALCGKDGTEYVIAADPKDDEITVSGFLMADEKLFFQNNELIFNIAKEIPLPKDVFILREYPNSTVFYSKKLLDDNEAFKLKNYRVKEFIDFNNICFKDNPDTELRFERTENTGGTTILLQNPADYGKIVFSNNLFLRVNQLQAGNLEKWRIQLKELNEAEAIVDELSALSPLRYFFEDDVTIEVKNDWQTQYFIDREGSNPDELQIVLRRKSTKDETPRNPFCFPPDGSTLRVKVNTMPLMRQLAAVSILKQMPHKNHQMLIKLFEAWEKTRWGYVKKETVKEWFVLKDETRSGCPDQREFIQKALGTPDFAILEGPPGSGKTTVILELICQLVSQGKRVLLCGSTNVAIDNILERLIEKKNNNKSLLESIDILPVRIGRAERVDPRIAAYQIDNLLGDDVPDDEKKWKQRLLLEAANLVCGTTMGIANHPKFKEHGGYIYNKTFRGDTPVTPEFDYLVIDECSKTTFQEFLVPAIYAKRWILAGDVMQLSPFTERDNIEYNFENLPLLKNKQGNIETLDKDIQHAVFCLEKMSACFFDRNHKLNKNRFVLPVTGAVLEKMVIELECGRINRFPDETVFVCITKQNIESHLPNILVRSPLAANYLEMTGANLVLVANENFDDIKEKIPVTHAVLRKPDWEDWQFAFFHNAAQRKIGYNYYSPRRGEITDSFEIVEIINKDFLERSWAQEIAWRVDSEHQLRLVDKNRRKESLAYQIEDLTPLSVDKKQFEDARNLIVAMSFPSILESLVTGIRGRKPRMPSTITEGFIEDDLNPRKTTLAFQHRMHPQISSFPRSRFYKDSGALQDLELPNIEHSRQWNYLRYKNRSVWADVRIPEGNRVRGSVNIFEVQAMIRELGFFLKYAKNNPQPEGKDWEVACLAFYRGQEKFIREGGNIGINHVPGLQELTVQPYISSYFYKTNYQGKINIRLHTVDKFQGHEADIVFLSMSQTQRDGFLDNPNRLNVGITRAKFQLVIFGDYQYFSQRSKSEDLRALAQSHVKFRMTAGKE